MICYKDTGGWRVDDPKGKCSSIPVDVYPLPCTQSRNPEEKEVAQQKGLTEVEAVHSPEGAYAHGRAIRSLLIWRPWLLGAPGLLKGEKMSSGLSSIRY